MPAAVAVPLITTAIGTGVSLYQQKKQNDAAKKAAQQYNAQAATMGGGGGGSSSGGSHSWSRGGTVIDPAVRDAAFGANQAFLKDGGLSQEDLAAMRARALSPVRAVYSNARREVDRSAALSGGYAPNRIAALARMGREQGQATADAATNAEAGIIGMRQQGRMAGLQGMNSMYANMPTFNESESNSWNSSSSGGSDGPMQVPVPSGGIGWGDAFSTAANVGLPILLNAYSSKKPPTTGQHTRLPTPTTGLPGGLPGTPVPVPTNPYGGRG